MISDDLLDKLGRGATPMAGDVLELVTEVRRLRAGVIPASVITQEAFDSVRKQRDRLAVDVEHLRNEALQMAAAVKVAEGEHRAALAALEGAKREAEAAARAANVAGEAYRVTSLRASSLVEACLRWRRFRNGSTLERAIERYLEEGGASVATDVTDS